MTSDKYFPALTGFRAIAAWLVFAHHYNPFSRTLFVSSVVDAGYIGVSMFFVLSGFLITVRYDSEQLSFGWYMQKRFARIYPLYFLLTTLTFFVAGEWGWIYIANITFIKGFSDELKFTGISQGWSLTVEETFYVLAPMVFLAIRKSKLAWFIPVALVLICWNNFVLTYTFLGRSFDFFAGIFLAKAWQHKVAFKYFTWTGIAGLIVCLVFPQPFLVPVVTVALMYGLLNERTWLHRLLSTPPMQLFGKSSYAFYLVHIGVMALWLSKVISSNPLVLFVLLNAVSIALYYTVERPLRQYFLPKNDRIKP